MKNKGFTLIELLAVIVILGVIALIAVPIIIGIVNDSIDETNKRSIDMYASAVENAVITYQLSEQKKPTSIDEVENYISYKGSEVVCQTRRLYSNGTIYLGSCTVDGKEVDYEYGEYQPVKLNDVCKPADGSETYSTEEGTKYNCKVDPNKDEYTFFVLNSDTQSVNLIMDSNINKSGEAVKSSKMSDKGLVEWVSKSDYIRKDIGGTETDYGTMGNWNKGPITAIEYLQEATKTWTNTTPQTISTFTDNTGATHNIAKTYTANARMPYYSEVSNVTSETVYLIDNLYGDEDYLFGIIGRNKVSGVYGYWILFSHTGLSSRVWSVYYYGMVGNDYSVNLGTYNGIRPVITLSL